MRQDDDQGDMNQSPASSTLPSIRELFGIRTGDNLHALVTSPSRLARSTQPPPSSFPQQALQIPAPDSPELRNTTSVRSHSFSSGQAVDVNHATRGRRSSPAARSAAASAPYTTSPQQSTPRSARYPHSSHSPSNVGSQLLPPLSTAVPEILPMNRMRAVSDSEAIARGILSPSSSSTRGTSSSSSSGRPPPSSTFLDYAAVKHPSLRTDANVDSLMDQRRHIGRSTVQTPSGAHYPSPSSSSTNNTRISHPHSSGTSDDPEQNYHWSAGSRSRSSSRNAPDYPSPSSALEYSPHPFSSASLAAATGRQGTNPTSHHHHHQHLGHGSGGTLPSSSSLSPPGYHGIEGQVHTSPSRGSERAPPSSFPQQQQHHGMANSHGSGNRPRSGNSSEGDETKSGFGKYECEYCAKRFNRPSSLRIHINTHTGAKPFQCPFPNCGRRFSVMSNMRRHARTHGTLLAPSSSADDENGLGSYQDGPADGGPSPSQRPAVSSTNQLPMSAEPSSFNGRERQHDELNKRQWPESSSMEVDELEDEEEEEMETDGGTSESESYADRKNSISSDSVHPSLKFGMLAKIRTDA